MKHGKQNNVSLVNFIKRSLTDNCFLCPIYKPQRKDPLWSSYFSLRKNTGNVKLNQNKRIKLELHIHEIDPKGPSEYVLPGEDSKREEIYKFLKLDC